MWDTLTHARVRAAQGDIDGARRILRGILQRDPDHTEALGFLGELDGRRNRSTGEPTAEPAPPARPASAAQLARRFRRALGGRRDEPETESRIERLRAWLDRITERSDGGS